MQPNPATTINPNPYELSGLVGITTNPSRGTAEQIPFREEIWAFDPEELSMLFPRDVVDHMVRHSKTDVRDEVIQALGPRLRLLPKPEDLPIIVAVRMSLSFPVLLAAVPLYGLTPRLVDGTWNLEFVRNWFSDGDAISGPAMAVPLSDGLVRWFDPGVG